MATRTTYTFDELFNIIKDKVNEFTSNKPTFWGLGSVARSFAQSVAHLADWLQLNINVTYLSFRTKTARGLHLDYRMEDYGLSRNFPTQAVAVQKFIGVTGRTLSVTIPVGTVVETEPNSLGDILSYTLNNELTLLTGDTFVTGYVTCTTGGTLGNVSSGKIINLAQPINDIESTTNLEIITNGTDLETDEDLRTRLPAYLVGLKKANEQAIESAIRSVEGVTYVKIVENFPTSGIFTAYVNNETGIIDSVQLENINNAIKESKAFCISYSVVVPQISGITLSFDLEANTTTFDVVRLTSFIKQTLFDSINNIKLNKLYRSEIIRIVKDIEGVINIKNVLINGVDDDLLLTDLYVVKISDVSDITITVL